MYILAVDMYVIGINDIKKPGPDYKRFNSRIRDVLLGFWIILFIKHNRRTFFIPKWRKITFFQYFIRPKAPPKEDLKKSIQSSQQTLRMHTEVGGCAI